MAKTVKRYGKNGKVYEYPAEKYVKNAKKYYSNHKMKWIEDEILANLYEYRDSLDITDNKEFLEMLMNDFDASNIKDYEYQKPEIKIHYLGYWMHNDVIKTLDEMKKYYHLTYSKMLDVLVYSHKKSC